MDGLTVPRILKNLDGVSEPMVVVETARTPRGKVKPHQPVCGKGAVSVMSLYGR